uniref:Cyclin N-terminal domain-containing protein n=1 Tax=Rhodosorus marinus TaxID=101924 RepID=A0A7S2ZBH5_9RHOD|mmetsp:Transcript_12740/g.51276  ORF Transcript_12740/g.51276 Transcript_12740/m.51276 type:complete len:246 (+) Transcript_12740:146-883(+)
MDEEVMIACDVRIEEVSEAIELLTSVGIGIGLSAESILCGTHYTCKFVSRVSCSPSDVRAVGLVSLLVAVKMVEPDLTKPLWNILSRSLKHQGNGEVQRLRDLEHKIVSTLQWRLVFYSPIHYLNRLLYNLNIDVSSRIVRQFSSQLLLEALLSTGKSLSSTRSRKRGRSILDQKTVLRSTSKELAASLLQHWVRTGSRVNQTPVPGQPQLDTADECLSPFASPQFESSKRVHVDNSTSTRLRAA